MMNERDIFLAALDLDDVSDRAAYLDRACGGNAALRAQVEALLRAHESAGSFLAKPAIDVPVFDTGLLQASTNSSGGLRGRAKPDDEDLAFLSAPRQPGSLGRIAHYEVFEVLGRGAFGIVFRAFDELLQRVVAVKVLAPQLAVTSPARKRFLREAQSSAKVRHENVVQVFAVEEKPLPFLVMEFIPGESLQQRLDRLGPLDASEAARIAVQIAAGLAAAHDTGLIHRDIKPGNILIEAGAQHRVKITDFGLARAADDASMTQSGLLAGTPMFMSPEQAKGERIDHRADLFSLGSVLYTMCSGRPPFRANSTLAVLKRVAEDTPRPIPEIIPEVPPWLCDIIARLHAKSPDDRFASAKEVAQQLEHCLAELGEHGTVGSTAIAMPPAAPSVALKPPRQQRRWAAAAMLALSALALGIAEAAGVTDMHGTVVRWFSPDGTLVVEVDDPSVSVTIDGQDLVMTGTGAKEIRLKPGQYHVKASKDGTMVREALVTVVRGGRQVARVSLETSRPGADVDTVDWEQTVAGLPAEDRVRAVVSRLKKLNPGWKERVTPLIEDGIVTRLTLSAENLTDLAPVHALAGLKSLECNGKTPIRASLADLSPLRGMKLTALNCDFTHVSDLSALRGMPLETLGCTATDVADLSPLAGAPLRRLYCDNTNVGDLTPLRGMPLAALNASHTQVASLAPLAGMSLTSLWVNNTRVADLSPLVGMSLEWITIHNTNVSDLSPLKGMPLSRVYIDFVPRRDAEILRSIATLRSINDTPAADFWRRMKIE